MSESPAGPTSSQTETRAIELEVEVPGTPEEVWRAIATGPGISSWYVPHEVDEHEGGSALARFGPDEEMQAPGRVAVWDPPNRVVFDDAGAEAAERDQLLWAEWLAAGAADGASAT